MPNNAQFAGEGIGMRKLRLTWFSSLAVIALISLLAIFLYELTSPMLPPMLPRMNQSQAKVFDEVWKTASEHFFPNFYRVDWQSMREKYRPKAMQAQSKEEVATVINQMLAELKTSHTHFYTTNDPAYYQLLGIFLPDNTKLQKQLENVLPNGKPEYSGIGFFTKDISSKTFVSAILDGSPAAIAGLLVGDQLLNVDGEAFHPIQSFAGKLGQPVTLLIQRSSDSRSQQKITVIPKIMDGTTMFLDAMDASTQIIERKDHKIGYIHIWSYAGEQYQQKLKAKLLYSHLKDTDGLVLDLRDGWGGASPTYLNLYTPRSLSLTSTSRDQNQFTSSSAWSKPVVMLVNEQSRSGKEILAYGFRKYSIGPVVGSKTAGAVVQGNSFVMGGGSLLYLAIGDLHLDGGQRLEGIGVTPDIEVSFPLEYAQGVDPQKERAIAVALSIVERQ